MTFEKVQNEDVSTRHCFSYSGLPLSFKTSYRAGHFYELFRYILRKICRRDCEIFRIPPVQLVRGGISYRNELFESSANAQ